MFALVKKFVVFVISRCAGLIKEDGFFFVVLIILNLPIIFLDEDFWTSAMRFWFGAFALFLVTATLHLLPMKIRRFLQTALTVLFALIFMTDIFLLQKFDVPLNLDTLQILLGTNPLTAKAFLQEYVLNFKILGGLAAFVFFMTSLTLGLQKFLRHVRRKGLSGCRLTC